MLYKISILVGVVAGLVVLSGCETYVYKTSLCSERNALASGAGLDGDYDFTVKISGDAFGNGGIARLKLVAPGQLLLTSLANAAANDKPMKACVVNGMTVVEGVDHQAGTEGFRLAASSDGLSMDSLSFDPHSLGAVIPVIQQQGQGGPAYFADNSRLTPDEFVKFLKVGNPPPYQIILRKR